MEADLRRLASLEPTHRFGPEARPEIHNAFERLSSAQGSPMSVVAQAEARAGAVHVTAAVRGDPLRLVRSVRVSARADGGAWQTEEGGEVVLPIASGAIEYYAVAIGPGGAALASVGSEHAPLRLTLGGTVAGADPSLVPSAGGEGEGEGDGTEAWPWIALGGVLGVTLVVVVIALLTGGESDVTQPGAPRIFAGESGD